MSTYNSSLTWLLSISLILLSSCMPITQEPTTLSSKEASDAGSVLEPNGSIPDSRRITALPPLDPYSIPAPQESPSSADYVAVEVFYATDRNDTSDSRPRWRYGIDKTHINYGTAVVSIPRSHQIGALERPFEVLSVRIGENPDKHVVLLELNQLEKTNFLAKLEQKIATSREAFVFIHGFNVTFEAATHRTAQIAYDLVFEGAPIMYSWPSAGREHMYIRDGDTIRLSYGDIKDFLSDVAALENAETVHLIAHSMGSRGLVAALEEIAEDSPERQPEFQEIILTAPDINARIFVEDIASKILPVGERITLYASSRDRALNLSQGIHRYQRLGDTRPKVTILEGMDTIDVSDVISDFWGHNYVFSYDSIISDMFDLFLSRQPPPRFGLEEIETPDGHYWKFKRR